MRKQDFIFIGIVLVVGLALLLGFKIAENTQKTGQVFAKVTYRDELILLVDLETFQYQIYDTDYRDQIDVGRASEGIFYVPGSSTTLMTQLYEVDEYARDKAIVGVKLLVRDGKIEVSYQESPRNICQLQRPTNSSLMPLVCLPNELIVSVYTNIASDDDILDGIVG